MFIDHLGDSVIGHLPGIGDKESGIYLCYSMMRLIGRLAFPLFIYMLIEGFSHTGSRLKYLLRLIIFALISEIPFDIAFYGAFPYWKHQNIFFTLSLGLMMLICFDYIEKKGAQTIPPACLRIAAYVVGGAGFTLLLQKYMSARLAYKLPGWILYLICALIAEAVIFGILVFSRKKEGNNASLVAAGNITALAAFAVAGQYLEVDYHYAGILAIGFMYLTRRDVIRSFAAGCGALAVLSGSSELMAFLDIPIMILYNGQRGKGMKYFFYAFYPAHLTLLVFIVKYQRLIKSVFP